MDEKWLLKLIDQCKVVYGRHVSIPYELLRVWYCSGETYSNITDQLELTLLSFKDHITAKANKAYGVLGIII